MSEKEAEELLLELKEKAELMVDLAYSSVLYDNKEIAKEVYELEDFVDALNEELQKLAIKDVKSGELELNEALAIIQLGSCSEAIADAARDIADVELRDVEMHPVLRESIMEADEVFIRARVEENSVLKDARIGEIKLASKTGMWIIAIKRNGKWIYDPDKNMKIMGGDILFCKGTREGMEHFIKIAEGEEKEI